ncbi:unnamed protein product, partial [Mesorhabditis belari]|uniref:MHC class I antigen n=1 Tax=Mesorhabditis belari TaxID=2138241 RepID=A0AAF3F0E2_9BILA
MVDGRLIKRKFLCTDNTPNIVLADTEERWDVSDETQDVDPEEDWGVDRLTSISRSRYDQQKIHQRFS